MVYGVTFLLVFVLLVLVGYLTLVVWCRWLRVVTACNCVLGCFLWCLGFLFVIALGLWFGFAFDVPLFCVDGSVGLCIVGV